MFLKQMRAEFTCIYNYVLAVFSHEAGREVLQKYALREAEDRAMGRSEL